MDTSPETLARFYSKTQPQDSGCIYWTGARLPKGYGRFQYEGRLQYAHRVSYQLVYGDIAEGMFICHTCDNPSCVNPDHLFSGTIQDNANDWVNKGLSHYGEKSSQAKLTWEIVAQIRSDIGPTYTLAKKYGVSQKMIWNITRNKNWVFPSTQIQKPEVKLSSQISSQELNDPTSDII